MRISFSLELVLAQLCQCSDIGYQWLVLVAIVCRRDRTAQEVPAPNKKETRLS